MSGSRPARPGSCRGATSTKKPWRPIGELRPVVELIRQDQVGRFRRESGEARTTVADGDRAVDDQDFPGASCSTNPAPAMSVGRTPGSNRRSRGFRGRRSRPSNCRPGAQPARP